MRAVAVAGSQWSVRAAGALCRRSVLDGSIEVADQVVVQLSAICSDVEQLELCQPPNQSGNLADNLSAATIQTNNWI